MNRHTLNQPVECDVCLRSVVYSGIDESISLQQVQTTNFGHDVFRVLHVIKVTRRSTLSLSKIGTNLLVDLKIFSF